MLVYQFQRSYKNLETLNEGQNFNVYQVWNGTKYSRMDQVKFLEGSL